MKLTPPRLEWPSTGFDWKPKWKALLPVMRGVHAPPLHDAEGLLAQPITLEPGQLYAGTFAAQAARLGRPAMYWAAEQPYTLPPERLRQPDLGFWLDCLLQQGFQRSGSLIRICAALHPANFTVEVLLTFLGAQSGTFYWLRELTAPVRCAVALAEESVHAKALAIAESWRTRSELLGLAAANIFAHRGEWAHAWLAVYKDDHGLLWDCALSPEAFAAYVSQQRNAMDRVLPGGLLLQLRLHGEAASATVEKVLDRHLDAPIHSTDALQFAVAWRSPALFPLLARVAPGWRKARDTLMKEAAHHPAAVLLATLQQAAAGRSRAAELCAMRFAAALPEAWSAAVEALEPPLRARCEAMRASHLPTEAAPSLLPPILREPPWLDSQRPGELPVLQMNPLASPHVIGWATGQREAYLQPEKYPREQARDAWGFPAGLKLTEAGAQRLLAGQLLQPGDHEATWASPAWLTQTPGAAQLALWNSLPPQLWTWTDWEIRPMVALLAQHGAAAVPGAIRLLQSHRGKGPSLAALIDAAELVDGMTHLLRNSRLAPRDNAMRWIARYPRTVLLRALPQAFAAEHSAERDNARHAVRWLAERGERETALTVATEYGTAMAQAARQLLDTDPLYVLPGEMPVLPAFFEPIAFRRPLLAEGGALPLNAVTHLGHMLRLSQPDAPYPGVALVRAACTPASLAEFAWDLFEAWVADGMPAKEQWAYRALALLGDDETARRLLPRINEWAQDMGTRPKAMLGMQLLAAIGTDVALMLLNVLAAKGKHKRLQERASTMIAEVAQRRGMTLDELSDRLVPTLGLDGAEGCVLDFGPRCFSIAFDEALRPLVRDEKGARLKDLPKPNKADDAAMAAAAVARFKDLKKDVKTIASLQVTRLERAMLLRRRWPAADFRQLFVEHPLARHLACRITWGLYEDALCVRALRVAEDWTLTDASDEACALADDALVGLPHVLELPEGERQAVSHLFAEYEIAQPFKQLTRETFALAEGERNQTELTRWDNKDVAAGSLLGLAQRTWERGPAEDGGMICSYWRPAHGGLRLEFDFQPGIFAGGGMPEYRQTLGKVRVLRQSEQGRVAVPFSELDPIDASELVRDLESLAPARDAA